MVLFEIHRMFDSQVTNISGCVRTEMVMRVLIQWMVSGQVLDCPVHGRRPDVIRILKQLRERSPRNAEFQVEDGCRQILEGLIHGIEQLDIRERGVDERAVGGQDWLQGREIWEVQRDIGPTIVGKNSCEPVRDRFHGGGVRIVQSVEDPADIGP